MELEYELGICATRAALVLKDQLTLAMPGFVNINFQAGTLKEITETLNGWSKDDVLRFEKMPIICLITPFMEPKRRGGDLKQARFTSIVAAPSEPTWKRMERQTKSFEPILNPIVKEYIRQVLASAAFQAYETELDYTLIKHDYWGKDKNKSIFNETVDAIEIRDFTINLTPDYCI